MCWMLVHILFILTVVVSFTTAEVKWPSGTYGLPQPQIGCPDDSELTWKTGWTYHDTEDDNPANQRSAISHMAGNFTQHGIQQKFCIKDSAAGGSDFWPEGKYCIYKKGVCPTGLKEGFIRWDDEQSGIDLNNANYGSLPDGIYEKTNTTVKYCCNTRGNINNPIKLPNLKPFYLLTYDSAQCQKVRGMRVTSEFIKFDDDDQGNTDGTGGAYPYGPSEDPFNLKIYYCYYEPGQESTEDLGIGKQAKDGSSRMTSPALAVAVGCGVAGAIVGTATVAFIIKKILAKRRKTAFDAGLETEEVEELIGE